MERHEAHTIEVEDPRGDDEELSPGIRYGITSYGSDMPVDGLVRRLRKGDIFVPPFQRKFVWTRTQASRFIESLLLGLPVPGVFLFREPESRKLIVVDGQQRLLTLLHYYDNTFRGQRQFKLVGVSDELRGRSYDDLSAQDRRELDDAIVHATIFQQDQPSEDQSSIISVFERLNTGGTTLQAQEIRACLYEGPLNDLLAELAQNTDWRKIYAASGIRRKDEEIILRFLALYDALETYERPMKQFLNSYMAEHRNPGDGFLDMFRKKFSRTVEIVARVLTPEALRPERNLNVSVTDAVFVGLAHRLDADDIHDEDGLRTAHRNLVDQLRSEELYKVGTTDEKRVTRRIQLARSAYGAVR